MELFKVQTLEKTAEMLRSEFSIAMPAVETLPLIQCLGRVVAEDLMGVEPVPHFPRSVVDGYGVRAQDTFGTGESAPGFLNVVGSVEMGKGNNLSVSPGTAVYVPTGGALPAGADAVVMVEYAEKMGETAIAVYRPVAPGENTLGAGEDLAVGELLVPKGQRLRPQDIGVLAASGVVSVPVVCKPRVSVISTGDEIVSPEETPGQGQIRDINTYTLAAQATMCGAEIIRRTVVKDDFQLLKQVLDEALEDSDVILLSGGSSVGVKDYTSRVIESFSDSEILVHGLAVKPGKPTVIAQVQGKPVFGLPGQPSSAMMVFEAVVKPFISAQMGETKSPVIGTAAIAGVNMPSAPGRTTFQMVTLENREGRLTAIPVHGKSGMISLMSRAHGYIRIDARKEGITKGETVHVVLF